MTVARYENNWHVSPFRDALLQMHPIENWKRDIQDKATRNRNPWADEKFLCGRKCLRLPASATDQQFQRFAHRDIVVNDKYDCRGIRHGELPQFMPHCVRSTLCLSLYTVLAQALHRSIVPQCFIEPLKQTRLAA